MKRSRFAPALVLSASLLLAACGEATAPSGSGAALGPSAPPINSVIAGPAAGGGLTGFQRVLDQPHLTDGRPLTLYVGAHFCPFCATMRWPLVKALGRFGTFAGLREIRSTSGVDGFESLSSYDFSRTTYRSDFVTFRMVEVADNSGNPLQQPDRDATALLNQFDRQGAIPFVFVAGSYVAQLPFSPGLLRGKSFKQIEDDVASASPGPLGRAVNQEADALTALICKTNGAQPASVCGQPAIAALVQQAS